MECEKKEYQLQAVCFAASTAVFIACLERAVVKSFMEQWRVLMFLALNLLLLAILFTSTSAPCLSTEGRLGGGGGRGRVEDIKAESRKRRKQCRQPSMAYADNNGQSDEHLKLQKTSERYDDGKNSAEVDAKNQLENDETNAKQKDGAGEAEQMKDQQAYQLSKEELNERVEAFIAMFRQHLISDAKGRSCTRFNSSTYKSRGVTNHNVNFNSNARWA